MPRFRTLMLLVALLYLSLAWLAWRLVPPYQYPLAALIPAVWGVHSGLVAFAPRPGE